jgi:hypothetical protein
MIDLRTIYTGQVKTIRKHSAELIEISKKVHDLINELFTKLLTNKEQAYVRECITQLACYEAQLSDLYVQMELSGSDSTLRNSLSEIRNSITTAQRRLERVLSSLQNEANNAQ